MENDRLVQATARTPQKSKVGDRRDFEGEIAAPERDGPHHAPSGRTSLNESANGSEAGQFHRFLHLAGKILISLPGDNGQPGATVRRSRPVEVAASGEAHGKLMDGRGKQRLFPTAAHNLATGFLENLGRFPTAAWKILRSKTRCKFPTTPTGPTTTTAFIILNQERARSRPDGRCRRHGILRRCGSISHNGLENPPFEDSLRISHIFHRPGGKRPRSQGCSLLLASDR